MTLPRALLVRFVAVLLVAAATGWAVVGLGRVSLGADVDSFSPTSGATAADLDDVGSSFGGDPVVALIEVADGSPLDSARLPALVRLEGRLASLDDVAVVYGPGTTLNQTAAQAQQLMASIAGYRDGLREVGDKAALRRFETRYGALAVAGMPAGLPTLENSSFVRSVVFDATGAPRSRWRYLVPDVHSVALYVRPRQDLDATASARLGDAVRKTVSETSAEMGASRVTVTGVPVVSSSLAEQVRHELPLLGGGAVAAVAVVLLLLPWSRFRRRLWPLLPMSTGVLVTAAAFGWAGHSVSLGAVMFLPLLLGLGTYYPMYLIRGRHRRVVLAVVAASAAAFATLALSPLPFVRDLGIAVPLGLLVAVGVTLALPRRWTGSPDAPTSVVDHGVSAPTRSTALVGAAAVVTAALGWLLLPGLPVETRPEALLRGADGYTDARYVEDRLGFAAELDIVLDGPDVMSPEALAWSQAAEETVVVRHGDELQPIVSPGGLLGFLGPEPTAAQVSAALELLPPYLTGAVVTFDRTRSVVALGADLDDLETQRTVISGIRRELPPPPDGYEVRVVGLPVAAAQTYDTLTGARHVSNLVGIGVAALVLALGLARRRDAARAALVALVATGWGFLVAAALDLTLDPLTLALGSLTAAVGCEFAVLTATARRTGDLGLRRLVGGAALLSATGYGALVFSGIDLVRQFGLVMVGSVLLALIASIVMTADLRPLPRTRAATESAKERTLEMAGVS